MNIIHSGSENYYTDFDTLLRKIAASGSVCRVCDIGGGAKPNFTIEEIEQFGIEYVVLDISQTELDKADSRYLKVQADIGDGNFEYNQQFDLVFSRNVAEHIKNGANYHTNLKKLLKPGGRSVHIFPTLFTLPFFINRITPERIAAQLLSFFSPRDNYLHAKFPAYYNRCRGPIQKQIRFFTSLGFDINSYHAMYGHDYLYQRFNFLLKAHKAKSRFLQKHKVSSMSSYAMIDLQIPQ